MERLKPAIIGIPASLAWVTVNGIQQGIQIFSSLVGAVIACISLWVLIKNLRKPK